MTKKEIMNTIKNNFIGIDKIVQRRNGEIVLMKGFFYKHGMSAEKFKENVFEQFSKNNINNISIIDCYEQWKDFRGGSSVDKQSHFGVIFKVV